MNPTADPGGTFWDSYLHQQEAVAVSPSSEEETRPGEWRNLWTWIEIAEGEILPASLEILGRAREIANELGTRNCGLLLGHNVESVAERLGEYGADRIYLVDDPAFQEFNLDHSRDALVDLVLDRRPEILLFPTTIQGRNLAAQASRALQTGIIPNCNGLTLDATERLLVGHQASFEERLLSDVVCPVERPQIFTLVPGSFRRPPRETGRRAQVVKTPPPALTEPRVVVQRREADPTKSVSQYDAIVVGGLGLASSEGFQLAQKLAQELRAYPGATRGAVSCGWARPDQLITVTQHRLRPRLYLACGVVGEYDHLKAIERADFVVALTRDPQAPIVENADLVGVGDPTDLLRRLLADIQKAKEDRFMIS